MLSKKMKILVAAALLGIGAACSSVVNVDPQSDVSLGSYRAAVVRIQKNLYENLLPSWIAMRDEDLASPHPQHSLSWWNAKIGLAGDTCTLCSDTLAGKNAGKAPAPK